MNELEQPQNRRVLPIISGVTFLGFLDTHLLLPVMALYASGPGASVGYPGFGFSHSFDSLKMQLSLSSH